MESMAPGQRGLNMLAALSLGGFHGFMPDRRSDRPNAGEHLARQAAARRSPVLQALAADVLIVDDDAQDADVVTSMLRALFGSHIKTRHAKSLPLALAAVSERAPRLIVLDDILPPGDRADGSAAVLRAHGYCGPIVVVSGVYDPTRAAKLRAAGLADFVAKDDLNGVRLAEVMELAADGRRFRRVAAAVGERRKPEFGR